MTQKLCHVLATEKPIKTSSGERLTAVYQTLQQKQLLNGIARSYRPLQEEGEKFPDEKQDVQVRAGRILVDVEEIVTPLYDMVATRDRANCSAQASVEIDGKVLLTDVAVTTLLYLEKQLTDVLTVIKTLPELDSTETWHYDPVTDTYKTQAVETSKSKKISKPLVKYPATEQHPAQVDLVTEDILTGYWSTVKFSGAIPRERKRQLRERAEKLLAAVKMARETANQEAAPKVSVAKELFSYLLAT